MSLQCSLRYVPEGAGVTAAGGEGILIGSGTTGNVGELLAHDAISSNGISNAASLALAFGL